VAQFFHSYDNSEDAEKRKFNQKHNVQVNSRTLYLEVTFYIHSIKGMKQGKDSYFQNI